MKYRTRYAPSPTGMLHIGGVRTALFDYLAAKSSGGEFHIRIEDTDRERLVEGAIDAIQDGFAWLGLKNDGEVVYQSDRLPIYQKYVEELVSDGKAYKCFCSKERLEELRKEQEAAKKPPVYDRCCLNLSKEEADAKEAAGEPFVIRFRIPEEPKEITWTDKIRDKITIATKTLDDFIILKSDKWPTYHLANVIDDREQGFNLIIRGEEWIPSTPKHILLYMAFGWGHPEYAHTPVIVGSDMKKLSKRTGDTAVSEYKEKGYLPEALINFLALLGWNPGTTEEIFSLKELEEKFTIERVGKSPALFDIERLNWINGVYIRNLSVSELTDRLIKFDSDLSKVERKLLERIVAVEQTRIKTLGEFSEITDFYFELPKYASDTLVFKKSSPEATKKGLEAFVASLESLDKAEFAKMTVEEINELLKRVVEENELNNADVFWPVRVALSGLDKSPSPAELLWVLGKEESLTRLKKAL